MSCLDCASDAEFLRAERPPFESLRPRVRLADLFAGCGGLSLGTAMAAWRLGLGIDIRLAVDADPDAVAVYASNLPEADVRRTTVESLFDGDCGAPLTQIERTIKEQVGALDVLVGGPPCQGHSDLNNHTRREDPRNGTYARMARAAEVLKPSLVLIENVPTVTHDVDKVAQATKSALIACGYTVTDKVIDIARLGAPQRRRRHVMLASRDSLVDVENIFANLRDRCAHDRPRSVRWAIADLMDVKSDRLPDLPSTPNAQSVKRIAWLFEHERYDLPNHLRPPCHQSEHSYNAMYGRLRWDEPAQTITTGFGSMGQGRYVHPARRRTITPHEAARIQLIPDFWSFGSVEKKGALARLIGNAVPPVVACTLLRPAFHSMGLAPDAAFPLPEDADSATNVRFRTTTVHRDRHSVTRRNGSPAPSSPEAGRRMRSVRQRDTAAELALRAEVDAIGLTYEAGVRIPSTRWYADLLFENSGVVVLVDGCFWHACPQHGTFAKANSQWWRHKLFTNKSRDLKADQTLHKKGWFVLRFWEHDDPALSARRVATVVAARSNGRLAAGLLA